MNIIGYLKNIINRIKTKKQNQLLLDSPENLYKDLVNSSEINDIINNMPQNLSQLEKAYYIYLELGKIVSESPQFVFNDMEGKKDHYNDKIDDTSYAGICKSISELYVNILKDKRVGISADLVKRHPDSPISHVDTILKVDGKNYIVNLISDLSRIKTSRRANSFCFDLSRVVDDPELQKENEAYLKRLENHYGKIDSLSRNDIEKLDKKLGYSFIPKFSQNSERGIYTENTIALLKKEMDDPELFKKYVLHNEDVPPEELLKYKLDFIFDNINKLTDYNNNMNYLENIRYYMYIARKILSPEEASRIQAYAATIGNDLSNILSILKIKPHKNSVNQKSNTYYLYSTKDKKYVSKTRDEMKQFISDLDRDSLKIIGTFDNYKPRGNDELEL